MRLEDVTGEFSLKTASSVPITPVCLSGDQSKHLLAGDVNAAKLLQQLSAFKVKGLPNPEQLIHPSTFQTSGNQEADKDKSKKEGKK